MTNDFTAANANLARCKCGSKVVMQYEPGTTYIHCLAENKTVLALPDWNPASMEVEWNAEVRHGAKDAELD